MGDNRPVLRRVLLAALLCLSVWATADRVVARTSVDVGAALADASCLPNAPGGTDASDERWEAARASTTESVWRSQLHHATLARVGCRHAFDSIRRGQALPRQTRYASARPHHIPLLI